MTDVDQRFFELLFELSEEQKKEALKMMLDMIRERLDAES